MTFIPFSVALTATSCHVSYPRNSANPSPSGTVSVNLSCAAGAMPPTTASNTAAITIAGILPFISVPPLHQTVSDTIRISLKAASAHGRLHSRQFASSSNAVVALTNNGRRLPLSLGQDLLLSAFGEQRNPTHRRPWALS